MRLSQLAQLALVARIKAASASILPSQQPAQQSSIPYPANRSMVPIYATNRTITIKGSRSTPGVIVLDYGANVEGLPTFQVLSATGDTSGLEITYSESREVLDSFYVVITLIEISSAYTNLMNRAMDLLHWPQQWTPTESIDTTSADL